MSVLVAGTDTPAGHAAYRYGIEEARRRGEDLIVFVMAGAHSPSTELEDVVETVEFPDERTQSPTGDLIDRAEGEDVSALVIGVRHRSAVAKLFLGSSAQQIILEANKPVLCVKS
ncbi:MAG: universal stress protein [Brachybacterium sp.]|uniref:universal stress protein n=1 Tax=Brachybacterium sp. TaxID=1891286 RepID=UPI002654A46F|nr:universal stress protein [Brachybacterium sp.]MDN6302842.1 universal stress protein [Brachybacterium sp.]MDN6329239.1 universal stress protein [Brachybacterium sp.]MDN6400053.1 universal stress protein [Brachybacterium sp.]